METEEMRRLLELAAKAAGIASDGLGNCYDMEREAVWNPLEDDGDALRLAVALEIIVDNFAGEARVKSGWSYGRPNFHTEEIPQDGDPCAATRRAIVRAAAAIGETTS